jgi:hypothetical protein
LRLAFLPPLFLHPFPLSPLSLSPHPLSKRLDTEQKEKKKEYREEERKNNTYQTSLGFSSSWAEELFQGIPSGSEQIHTEKHFLNFPSFFFFAQELFSTEELLLLVSALFFRVPLVGIFSGSSSFACGGEKKRERHGKGRALPSLRSHK